MKVFYLLLFGIFGAVFVLLGIFGAEWYMRYIETRPLFRRLGRNGARVLTVIVGALLVLYGIAVFADLI